MHPWSERHTYKSYFVNNLVTNNKQQLKPTE